MNTYAWFTMNKQVQVVGMEVKAHAEEGLLINEIALATDTNWDEQATGNTTTAIELRPASTKDLTAWWHANSKRVNDEAGYGSGTIDTAKTVEIGDNTGVYYKNISGLTPSTIAAVAGSQAQTDVYYEDATFGQSGSYQNGEGYYVKYSYYLKSSNQSDLTITSGNLTANVKATLKEGTSGTSTDLDPALRVGVRVTDKQATPNSYFKIFAPVSNHDASNFITGDVSGSSYAEYTYAEGNTDVAINTGNVIVPNVNDDGILVEVFLWFEGEDSHCQSQYLTATLDTYDISIIFKDAAL